MSKYKVGVYLPLSYLVEVEAENEEIAKEKALQEAMYVPYTFWNDDYSKATAEVLEDD